MKLKMTTLVKLLIIGLLVVTACTPQGNQGQSGSSGISPDGELPYPPPPQDIATQTESYPPPSPTSEVASYPPPEQQTAVKSGGPPIQLDKPLKEGSTVITGSGPANLPILIVDVTFMREILAETVIGEDGTFSINLTALSKDHRIGIALSNLEGTKWENVDLNASGFFGEGALQVPTVGFFYDTALVLGE